VCDSLCWIMTVRLTQCGACLLLKSQPGPDRARSKLRMLNDNQIIDYRNGFWFSCLHYRFSKLVPGMRVLVAVSMEQLLALPITELKSLVPVYTSVSHPPVCAVACRQLARPVLAGLCDCRSSAGQNSTSPVPTPPAAVDFQEKNEFNIPSPNYTMSSSQSVCALDRSVSSTMDCQKLHLKFECSNKGSAHIAAFAGTVCLKLQPG